jgi:hypothetical protein
MGARLLESPDDGTDQHKLLMQSMSIQPSKIHNPRYISLSFPKQEWKDAGRRPSEKRNRSAIRLEEPLRFLRVASAALRRSYDFTYNMSHVREMFWRHQADWCNNRSHRRNSTAELVAERTIPVRMAPLLCWHLSFSGASQVFSVTSPRVHSTLQWLS